MLLKLITAINNGNKATLKALCKDKDLINSSDSSKWTPLMHAVKRENLEFVKILCQCGATVNVKDAHGRTPLMIASTNGFTNIVKFLAMKTSDLNAVDDSGMSAFMHAAKNGNLDAVAELFHWGIDVSLKDKNGFTAFMLASIEHHTEIVEFFQQKKVKVDKSDEKMWNYYLEMVVKKSMEDIRKLRESGAVVSVFFPADMCDHPFIELLKKSGCRISNSKVGKSQHEHMFVVTPSDEISHRNEPCIADESLYGTPEPLFCLDGQMSVAEKPISNADARLSVAVEPLSEVLEGVTGNIVNFTSENSNDEYAKDMYQDDCSYSPVLRKKSQDACGTAVFNLKIPSTYTALQDEDIREVSSHIVDDLTFLQFFQPSEQRFMNIYSKIKEFRSTNDSVDETKATYNKETENNVSAKDGEETVVRRKTHTKGQSNGRNGLYNPRKFNQNLKVKAKTLPRVRNVTIYLNLDIKNVEYLATDLSEININKET